MRWSDTLFRLLIFSTCYILASMCPSHQRPSSGLTFKTVLDEPCGSQIYSSSPCLVQGGMACLPSLMLSLHFVPTFIKYMLLFFSFTILVPLKDRERLLQFLTINGLFSINAGQIDFEFKWISLMKITWGDFLIWCLGLSLRDSDLTGLRCS